MPSGGQLCSSLWLLRLLPPSADPGCGVQPFNTRDTLIIAFYHANYDIYANSNKMVLQQKINNLCFAAVRQETRQGLALI